MASARLSKKISRLSTNTTTLIGDGADVLWAKEPQPQPRTALVRGTASGEPTRARRRRRRAAAVGGVPIPPRSPSLTFHSSSSSRQPCVSTCDDPLPTADRPSPASRRRPFAHLASISLGEGVARPAKPQNSRQLEVLSHPHLQDEDPTSVEGDALSGAVLTVSRALHGVVSGRERCRERLRGVGEG